MPKAPSSVSKKRGNNGASSGPKFSSAAPSRQSQGSLAHEMREEALAQKFGAVSEPGRRNKNKHSNRYADDDEDEDVAAGPSSKPFVTGAKSGGDKYVDKKLSGKILRLAREQQEEIEEEEERLAGVVEQPRETGIMPDDDDDDAAGGAAMSDDGDLGAAPSDEEEFEYEEIEVDPEEAELLERMRADRVQEQGGRRTLADLIMDKIEAAGGAGGDEAAEDDGMVGGMNPKIVEVYTK